MKKILFLSLLSLGLCAQKLDISDFQANLYSKNSKEFSKNISLSMQVTGRDVFDESYKVIDSLNIVIGSFYAHDLLSSKGKEAFKKALINYASSKYSVEIDEIFIQKLFVLNTPKVNEIVEALRQEGCCNRCQNQQTTLPKLGTKIEDKSKIDDDIIIIE